MGFCSNLIINHCKLFYQAYFEVNTKLRILKFYANMKTEEVDSFDTWKGRRSKNEKLI
jgi:hypothetical protein